MSGFQRFGNLARCFTEILQSLGNGVLVQGAVLKLLPAEIAAEFKNPFGREQHVKQISLIAPHKYS